MVIMVLCWSDFIIYSSSNYLKISFNIIYLYWGLFVWRRAFITAARKWLSSYSFIELSLFWRISINISIAHELVSPSYYESPTCLISERLIRYSDLSEKLFSFRIVYVSLSKKLTYKSPRRLKLLLTISGLVILLKYKMSLINSIYT